MPQIQENTPSKPKTRRNSMAGMVCFFFLVGRAAHEPSPQEVRGRLVHGVLQHGTVRPVPLERGRCPRRSFLDSQVAIFQSLSLVFGVKWMEKSNRNWRSRLSPFGRLDLDLVGPRGWGSQDLDYCNDPPLPEKSFSLLGGFNGKPLGFLPKSSSLKIPVKGSMFFSAAKPKPPIVRESNANSEAARPKRP